jgi:hypothetical protein
LSTFAYQPFNEMAGDKTASPGDQYLPALPLKHIFTPS